MVIVSLVWIGFDSVTRVLLLLRKTVAMPVCGPAVPLWKIAGAFGWTVRLRVRVLPPGVWSCRVALPSTFQGNWAVICLLETRVMGIGAPLTIRQVSPSKVGHGAELAVLVELARPEPRRAIKPPGAIGVVKSAALTTDLREGAVTAAA